MPRLSTVRVEFTREHDNYLFKYLATYCPTKEGRSGNKIYKELVENKPNLWPWSVHHTWQSWRTRYCKNSAHFDALISKYQRKPSNKHKEGRKRAVEPMPIDMLEPRAKRVKLGAEERVAASETRTEQGATAQHASSRPSTSKLTSERPREPQEVPSMVHPPRESEPTGVRPPSPPLSSTNTNTDTSENPTLDLPALQTRHDTPEISPSSPDKPAPLQTDGKPESRTPSRAVKRLKERPRTPSEVFASEPSSPRRGPAVVDSVGGAPVTDTVYPRAPPRVVDSLHGQVLVDRKGDVPRVLPHEMEDKAKKGGEEEVVRWPPARGRTAELKRVSGPHVEVAAHHPFSQSQPQSGPEAPRESVEVGEREQGKAHHPFGHVPPALDGTLLDRRTVVGRFAAGVRRGVAPLMESEQGGDAVQNDASPVKRVVPPASAAPPPDPLSGASKFPAPRASTRSPFRPEHPARETRHSPPRLQSRAKAMRHPALTRLRRQTIGHKHRNGNGHERERGQVPSIDLVALSRSSMSSRSHSDSSAGASVPARPPRWSLPAFAHATPWVFDEPGGAPSAPGSVVGSGSGSPFRWVAPSPVYSDIWRHRHARTSSLVGTSTPQFTSTPSPARSITAVATNTNATANTSVPHPNAISTSPTLPLAPHPADVPLAASHGLASILAYMSANHGLALGVVEAVYARVGGLREADEVLKGMREAAEGFGEKEIKRRLRGRREEQQGGPGRQARGEEERGNENGNGKERERTQLQYVVTSEDGEGSEYSPPETSRAAMWKRQSESVSHTEEEGGGKEDRDDEDEVEGRAVEQELRKGEGENSDEDGVSNILHDFSKHLQEALLENTKAQELERKLGKGLYRRHIVMQFI